MGNNRLSRFRVFYRVGTIAAPKQYRVIDEATDPEDALKQVRALYPDQRVFLDKTKRC